MDDPLDGFGDKQKIYILNNHVEALKNDVELLEKDRDMWEKLYHKEHKRIPWIAFGWGVFVGVTALMVIAALSTLWSDPNAPKSETLKAWCESLEGKRDGQTCWVKGEPIHYEKP